MLDQESKRIHDFAVGKASRYLLAEAELLSAIVDCDKLKIFEKFGETYLTPYCVKYLKLSEEVAAMFVRVARKSLQVPELETAVQDGLQMTKAKTIAAVITPENQEEWIEKAQTLSKENLEREVAAANPSAPKPEKVKPTGPNRHLFQFEGNDEERALILRLCELVSQKTNKNAGLKDALLAAAKDYVDREDPVRKAERAEVRKFKNVAKGHSNANDLSRDHEIDRSRERSKETQRGAKISAFLVHQVNLRDKRTCRKLMPDGTECGCRKWTDIHHIIPRSHGGSDTLENLITLCRSHHRQVHDQTG